MSLRSFASAALFGGAFALPLQAQSSQCLTQPLALRDACQKGTDIFAMLAPQVNGALAGGGPVLGSARAVNGISIGVRVNAVDGALPDLAAIRLSAAGAVRSTIPTSRVPVPAPTLDVALGVFPGFFVGVQRILSLDVLLNVGYIPNADLDEFRVKATNGSLKLGWGARVGLLSDRLIVPAVSVSYFRRSLPTASFSTSLTSPNTSSGGARDSLSLNEFSLRNDAIRLAVSKKLGFLEIGGGVGEDRYRGFSQLRVSVQPVAGVASTGTFVLQQEIKRRAAYGSVALNILRVRIGAEAGTIFGGDSIATFNSFTNGKINEHRLFGSVGLRIHL